VNCGQAERPLASPAFGPVLNGIGWRRGHVNVSITRKMRKMFVDSAMLRSGGSEAQRAGEHTQQAAEHLSTGSLPPQMFGDFAAAEALHEATGSTQAHHLRVMLGNGETLAAVGHNAHLAATEFTGIDENNATSVRAVRCDCAT
jgi:Protein of unknown function (DUF2563)